MLNNRNDLNDEVFKKIQPQNAKLARTYGIHKVDKICNIIPPFGPIPVTIGTTYCSIRKYLSKKTLF